MAHDISPRCLTLHNQATTNVCKKAQVFTSKLLEKQSELVFKLGDVELVPLDDVDRIKVDGGNLCGVVVAINMDKSTCRVVVKQGLLHPAYVYHALKPVPKVSNNLDVMELWSYGMHMKTGDHYPRSWRERQVDLYHLLGDRGSFTGTAGEVAHNRAVHAGKQIGFAAHVASGIARTVRINMIRSWKVEKVVVIVSFSLLKL